MASDWLFFPQTTLFMGYRIKIELICRLTKDRDQALISISTIQKFPAQVITKTEIVKLRVDK